MNWSQLRAILWLRWRLTINQWRRGGQLNAVIAILVLIFILLLAVTGGAAGTLVGAIGLARVQPDTLMYLWDGLVALFLMFWAIGVVSELQRSESIDLSRLLHLPVSLRGAFVFNYLASHLSLSLTLAMPTMLGLALGLLFGRGAAMLWLFPLILGFFFMITAWTYCLRGWLAALMVNKRRRRVIIMWITMAMVLLFQLPNLVTNVWRPGPRYAMPPQNASPEQLEEWLASRAQAQREQQQQVREWGAVAHRCVPFLWLPLGAGALAEGDVWPPLLGAAGMFAIGTWGLARAYRATMRFYRGGETSKPVAMPAAIRPAVAWKTILVERTLPAVPDEASALALATLRSMSRAPEVKYALGMNVLIFLVMASGVFLRSPRAMPDEARPVLACAAVALTFMGVIQLMFNHFGFDRSGFRSYVLLPTPRRYILLGKNLATLPVALATFAVYLILLAAFAHLGAPDVVAAVFEFVAAYLSLSALGNMASVLVPYRISAGSLKPTKMSGTTRLIIFLIHLLFPLTMIPIFLPAVLGVLFEHLGWLPGPLVTVPCALMIAALAALLYWRTLEPLGRLLQRREQAILQVVTQEVE